MPRRSKGPVYYPSKGAWFANVNGEAVKLAEGPKKKTEQLARERYDRVAQSRAKEIDDGDRSETGVVVNAYLAHLQRRVMLGTIAPNSVEIREKTYRDFLNFEHNGKKVGKLPYRELTYGVIERWLAARKPSWGTGNHADLQLRNLRSAFRWAAGEGELVSESAMARKGRPVKLASTDLTLKRLAITRDEHAVFHAQANRRKNGSFAQLLELLHRTGARPGELYLAQAEEWHPDLQAIVIDPADRRNVGRLKNRNKLLRRGRKRVIRIPTKCVALMEELVTKHPAGPLFTKESGHPWAVLGEQDKNTARRIAERFRVMVSVVNRNEKKKVCRKGLSLYSYRHGFITRRLQAGVPSRKLADLLDTSESMIEQYYSHVIEDHKALLATVDQYDD